MVRTSDENRRAAITREMAYGVVPREAFDEPKGFASEFEEAPDLTVVRCYRCAANDLGHRPDSDDVRQLRGHTARYGEYEFYVIEYPRFPAIDIVTTLGHGLMTTGRHVLAPYFSAVVLDRGSGEPVCYVLGQSPDGGTILRELTPTANMNRGPGCDPNVDEFLKLVRHRAAAKW